MKVVCVQTLYLDMKKLKLVNLLNRFPAGAGQYLLNPTIWKNVLFMSQKINLSLNRSLHVYTNTR